MIKKINVEELREKNKKFNKRVIACHSLYEGKIQIMPKCPIESPDDFSIWYTPGVAVSCRKIKAEPEKVWEQTNRGNSVAVVSDCTRVLGLGDIGPRAGLPVMEGKPCCSNTWVASMLSLFVSKLKMQTRL